MKTIRRLIYKEQLIAVGYVTLGFLALFFFFDFVDELSDVTKYSGMGYKLTHALLYVVLLVPNHLYELLPITLLIGTIFVMARFAQSSEYTILRTSGLGPWRALGTLLSLGAAFVVLTFAVGDYVAPLTDRTAQLLKARFQGRITIGQTGAWLKERREDHSFAVNVGSLTSTGAMQKVRIFEFDAANVLLSMTQASDARFTNNGWELAGVERTRYRTQGDEVGVQRDRLDRQLWPTGISYEMVTTALLKPDRMRTIDLFQYIQHLKANQQTAQRFEIEFWRKVFYPLSCLVMVVLALPFAYLHFRQRGIAGYVFGGVMAGISFFLLNNVFGYIGNLQNWLPWLTAAAPGLIYSMISLGAFGWLVLRR
jgi:lipopolysaccharide export system permease protein